MVLVDSKRGGVENHCKEVLTDLARLCWEEKHCDLTFICTADGTEVHAHIYLLSKVSSIIKQAATQFYQHHHGHMHVTLDGIDSPTLGTLIEFLYLGGTTMSHQAANNLYVLCEMLAINIDQSKITVTDVPLPKITNSDRVKSTKKASSSPSSSSKSSSSSPKPSSPAKSKKSLALYCYCKQPSSKDLLGCDFCPQWYHPKCLNISPLEARRLVKQDTWRCPECMNKLSPGSQSKKTKGKSLSSDGKIGQLDGENGFRLTPIKTELIDEEEWSSSNKAFSVDIQPLEKWGEKEGLVQMDKKTYRVWHNTETPTPSPPQSPSLKRKNLPNDEKVSKDDSKKIKPTAQIEPRPKNETNISKEDCAIMGNESTNKDSNERTSKIDSNDSMRKMILNRSRSTPRPVKREKPSFESTLGEIAAKEQEGIKEKKARMSMSSALIKGQNTERKVKKHEREKSSSHRPHRRSSSSKSDDAKKDKVDENGKKSPGRKKSAIEKDPDIPDFSETEEVNRPVEDAKQSPEKEEESGGDYDELFFCYICKSIYVTKGALDNHHKTAH